MKVYKKIVAALLASLMFGQTTNGLNLNFIKMENKNILQFNFQIVRSKI